MHKCCTRSRLVVVVIFAKGCNAVALRDMVDSKTQMSSGYVTLLLIRELLTQTRAHAQQRRNENCGFQSTGICSDNKLLYLAMFRESEITSSSEPSILGTVPSAAGNYLLVDLT